MKVTIEYDLDDHDKDDKRELGMAIEAHNMYMVLWEFYRNSNKGLEWSLDGKDIDKYEVLEMVYDKLGEILDQYHVDLSKWD